MLILKNGGFKVINDNGETEFEGISLKRFLEIITEEPDVIDAYRNDLVTIDSGLSAAEYELTKAALDTALANEIFSELEISDEY